MPKVKVGESGVIAISFHGLGAISYVQESRIDGAFRLVTDSESPFYRVTTFHDTRDEALRELVKVGALK
jgi:hypothetical protein